MMVPLEKIRLGLIGTPFNGALLNPEVAAAII